MTLMLPLISFENIQSMASQTMRISQNQNIEAEVFADLAHATLDVATLFSINPIVLRIFIFVGRIFSILSDYLPDHSMTPDETIFQLSMLILSGRTLYDDARKLVSSSTKSISFKDRKIYLIAFLPVGFSWMEYKALISDAFEWVELLPGKCLLEENDSLLLTYRGDVYQDVDGFNIQRYGTSNTTRVLDMIGNLSLVMQLIDSKCYRKGKIKNTKPATLFDIGQQQSQYKLRAGSDGSLLLRIKVNKLLDIANEDEKLFGSIKNLVSNGIQNRLIVSLDEWQNENNTEYSARDYK
eukprot:CAMPEP_0198266686 /NCGR_PEP_ID=MMETSP1447-20131203/29593_1 /TAXON_ID=420782 /ORGANISM="Chaetoceros dichaeta, Strain CCMP1751" /LENGTH=295 /DNA_ID=CAMNT_0043956893 /DNA_START=226 /DNA_END=1113 /DNA_ORIENTATION=+